LCTATAFETATSSAGRAGTLELRISDFGFRYKKKGHAEINQHDLLFFNGAKVD